MQNLHEISKHIFSEKNEKYFKMTHAEIFIQHAKQYDMIFLGFCGNVSWSL